MVSFGYLLRNFMSVMTLGTMALLFIPRIENSYLYATSWILYGIIQGLLCTGLWILGHECGHGALFPSQVLSDAVGWLLHSMLLTPYFSWKITHRRHHAYTNHMDKDNHYVPYRSDSYAAKLGVDREALEGLTADTPGFTLIRLLIQQTLGWPCYILFYITSGPESMHPRKPGSWWRDNHFNPTSPLFGSGEFSSVIISDIGTGMMAAGIYLLAKEFGFKVMILLYVIPWFWVNHWIEVATTYLQHNHPSVPRYEKSSWTFMKGALATVDRDLGWLGRFFLHNIVDFHVVHHLFPQIPFYHTKEATQAIIPVLRSRYREDKSSSFLKSLWMTFNDCQWVKAEDGANDGELWFQKGPSPAPELTMRKWRYVASMGHNVWM
ncbi:hypothetical protein N7528_008599 [Penicillium herquei]|nr:hypothetical protein N7528_008599 [Penicillium herquei]